MAVHDDPRCGGDETFHLPVLALYADLEVGSGSVCLPDDFHALAPAIQAGVLDDWLRLLSEARRALCTPDREARQDAPLSARDHGAA